MRQSKRGRAVVNAALIKTGKIKNIFDYLATYKHRSFAESAFNPLDGLVFSRLVYLRFERIVKLPERFSLKKAAKLFAARWRDDNTPYEAFVSKATHCSHTFFAFLRDVENSRFFDEYGWIEDHALLTAIAQSRRYAEIQCAFFVNDFNAEEEKQFAAITFFFKSDATLVAFRGTDVSITGWKENLNMAFLTPIPAQTKAVEYLTHIAQQQKRTIRLCGHSKGGNLAVYAAISCAPRIQERIVEVYNYDGPGFDFDQCILTTAAYQAVRNKIHTFVPQVSIVGMLLDITDNFTVVQSAETVMHFKQHDMYSWETANGAFITQKDLAPESKLIRISLMNWIDELSCEQRKELVTTIGILLKASGQNSFPDIIKNLQRSIANISAAWRGLEASQRRTLIEAQTRLIHIAGADSVVFWCQLWLAANKVAPNDIALHIAKLKSIIHIFDEKNPFPSLFREGARAALGAVSQVGTLFSGAKPDSAEKK
jgi:hypothetical protein